MDAVSEVPDSPTPDDSDSPRQPARARRSPGPGAPRPDEPAPLQNRPPPDWSASPGDGPPPELEDEAPGSYLQELGARGWNVAWAALNLLITLWIGLYGSLAEIGAEWRFLAEVAWKLLPLSNALLLLITSWQKASAYTRNSPGKSRWTLILSLGALLLWFALGSEITG